MPFPILAVGFFPWLVGLFTSILTGLFTWFVSFVALRSAARFAIVTTYVIAIAAITVTVATVIKGFIFGIQVTMPASLGAATYFLPSNINVVMGAYVSMRVAFFLYTWTHNRLTAYVRVVGAV